MNRRWSHILSVALVAVVLCQLALAQQAPGTLTGRIIDPNKNPLTGFTGATIHMKNTATEKDYFANIAQDATFSLTGLPPGTYDLTVPLVGAMYRTYTQKSVTLFAGQTLRMEVPIEWGINLGTVGDDPDMLAKDMERRAKDVSGPAPRTSDGKIDFTGLWVPVRSPRPPNRFPLNAWAADIQKKLAARPNASYQQNAASYCLPQSAIPVTLPFPYKFVQTPTVLVHLVEFMTPGYRQIFLDGRPHPTEWNPAWMGHSVGHWEGDTLVIDTVGFNEITPGFGIHTEKLHVVERMRRPDKGHLEVEITAEDPDAYTKPWTTTIYGALAPQEEILEFVCPENNKDPLHFGGLGWQARP
jgi:hypothetical protein